MEKEMKDPKYLYADILIALAQVDDHLDRREKELLDGIFAKMKLKSEVLDQMWLTPRSMDIIESILQDIQDESFKRCLLKDCYLVAYADDQMVPEEHKFISAIESTLQLKSEVSKDIHEWVKVSIAQSQKEQELFYPND